MKVKTTEMFKKALGFALNGDEDATEEQLLTYQEKIHNINKEIAALKREAEQLDAELMAISVVYGAHRK